MSKNTIIVGVVILVLVIGGAWYSMKDTIEQPVVSATPTATVTPNQTAPVAPLPSPMDSGKVESTTKEFTISGKNFAFAPATINVNKGDKVKITFVNDSGFHDFKIDEFGVATKQIQGGAQETVEFIADKSGSFEYYCSVGSHRKMGMVGTLVVN